MDRRVWIIGLDGAGWPFIDLFMQQGKLPFLKDLMQKGVRAVLRSTEPPLSPAAWTSFATGKRPGKHGVLDHLYRMEGTYDFSFVNGTLRGATPIWDFLSRQGVTVGIINVPLTYPPEQVRGFMVTGMYTPSDQHPFTYPPGLAQELKQAIGNYKVIGQRSKEDLDAALDGILEEIPMRTEAASYLARRYNPDLLVLVYGATDAVQHKFWRFSDPQHPHYEPRAPERYRRAIEQVYVRVDQALGRLIQEAPPNTVFILMSDHGSAPLHKYLYLNNWLIREGFMKISNKVFSRARYAAYHMGLTPFNLLTKISRVAPGLVDRLVSQLREQMSRGKSRAHNWFMSWRDIDWARTRAYAVGGNLGGVFVNLKGREPCGMVSPGREYEAVREQLCQRLGELVDPDTGERVVEKIWRRESLYEGPFLERIPDVVFSTTGGKYMAFGLHEFASHRIMAPSPWFSGSHSPDGVLIMAGNPCKRGQTISAAAIEDIAPTVLYLMGFPVPVDMDGTVLQEALVEPFLEENKLQFSESWDSQAAQHQALGPEEESAVRKQLEGLGYL
ncbi:MAG: alkaline phosphatase family protein [bacterium]